jgi:hypothetical protein
MKKVLAVASESLSIITGLMALAVILVAVYSSNMGISSPLVLLP